MENVPFAARALPGSSSDNGEAVTRGDEYGSRKYWT
jgi:hypothetical protein